MRLWRILPRFRNEACNACSLHQNTISKTSRAASGLILTKNVIELYSCSTKYCFAQRKDCAILVWNRPEDDPAENEGVC